ncbi:MAG TPA: TolC family protein [Polyangiales bacterium]|nr:TolC family protein [Polyangiales bacterium]
MSRHALAVLLSLAAAAQVAGAQDGPIASVSLADAMQHARRDPPAVLRAVAALHEAEAQSDYARSQWLPALKLEAGGGYAYDNQLAAPGTPRIEGHAITARGAASLEWTALDLARSARVSAAEATAASERSALAAVQDRAALLAAELYFRAAAADALVSAAELSLERRTQQRAAAAALVQAGTRSPVDVQRAEIERVSAEYALHVRKSERRAAFAALAAALGRPASELVRPVDPTAALRGTQASLARARALAFGRRQELRSAASAIEAREGEHDAALGARWPTLGASATASSSYADVRSGVGLEGDQYAATAGLFLRWPSFDPAIWGRAAATEAAVTVAARERDALRHDIDAQVVQAYYALERATTESQRAVAVLEAAEVAREAQNGRYLTGLASLLELLDAEDLEQDARERRIETTRDEAIARAQLLAACGEL